MRLSRVPFSDPNGGDINKHKLVYAVVSRVLRVFGSLRHESDRKNLQNK